jgi:hypothetical protein
MIIWFNFILEVSYIEIIGKLILPSMSSTCIESQSYFAELHNSNTKSNN